MSAEQSLHERCFFLSYEISHEKCSEIFPKMFEPFFCGSEKIPENFRQISRKITLQKIKEISPTSFCSVEPKVRLQGYGYSLFCSYRKYWFDSTLRKFCVHPKYD